MLHIVVEETALGTYIREVNDVKNRRRLTWRLVSGGKVAKEQGGDSIALKKVAIIWMIFLAFYNLFKQYTL